MSEKIRMLVELFLHAHGIETVFMLPLAKRHESPVAAMSVKRHMLVLVSELGKMITIYQEMYKLRTISLGDYKTVLNNMIIHWHFT